MQVEWDNIDSEKAGCVIAFNGMHTGIMVRHPSEDDYFIQADIWVEEDGIAKPKQVFYKVPLDKKDGWIDVVLSVDQKKKKIAPAILHGEDNSHSSNLEMSLSFCLTITGVNKPSIELE